MKRPRRVTKYENSQPDLWAAFFEADAYPALVSALTLSPLNPASARNGRPVDYGIRMTLERREAFTVGTAADIPDHLDSVVLLYPNKPEEAVWIPLCKRLLRTPVKEKRG